MGGRVKREGGGRGVAGKLNYSSTCRTSLENSEVRSGRTCEIVRRAFARHTRLYIRYHMFVRRAFARHTRLYIRYHMFVRRACTRQTRLYIRYYMFVRRAFARHTRLYIRYFRFVIFEIEGEERTHEIISNIYQLYFTL